MSKIDIPDPDELKGALKGLDRLLTATRWERAAIVFAYTRESAQGERTDLTSSDLPRFPMTASEFAAQGYHGLGSVNTVKAYRSNWSAAVEAGEAVVVEPGMTRVELPEHLGWPAPGGERVGHTQGDTMRARSSDTPEQKAQVAENLLAQPGVREAYAAIAHGTDPTDDGRVTPDDLPKAPAPSRPSRKVADDVVHEDVMVVIDHLRKALDALEAAGPFLEDSEPGRALAAQFSRQWDLIAMRTTTP